jgi:predicted enzyme related to lactoylglutathione lyase
MGAKLILIGMPFDNPDEAQNYYADVLDYDFAPSLSDEDSYHAIASVDGVDFLVSQRHDPNETSPMPHFSVDDLDGTVARALAGGGEVVWQGDLVIPPEALREYRELHQAERGPGTVTNRVGRAAIVRDPQGMLFGLVDPEEHISEHYRVRRFAQQLDAKQLRTHREAIRRGRRFKNRSPRP